MLVDHIGNKHVATHIIQCSEIMFVFYFRAIVGPAWMLKAAGLNRTPKYCRFCSQTLVM